MSEEKKHRKTGSIAVPFLITIFIGLLLIGGVMLYVYKTFFAKEDSLDMPPPRTGITTATPEDNHTILLILDERNNSSVEKKCSTTYVVMRSIPHKKSLLFIGIPSNSISFIDGQQQRLNDVYDRGGAVAAKEFVADTLDVDIDKYIVFNSDAFRRICDIFGNVKAYPVDAEIANFKGDGSLQNMSADQIETYVTYSLFKRGEYDRAINAANILRYLINGTTGERIAESLDRYFDEIINMTTSDITAVDYDKRKNAIKYMFNYGDSLAVSIFIDGEVSGNDFIPNRDYIKNLPSEYFQDETEEDD
ncbi:MAG: LCP family protein [Ruminococcus sp.]|nr:LCP family protein [Ruminococcus sp.]